MESCDRKNVHVNCIVYHQKQVISAELSKQQEELCTHESQGPTWECLNIVTSAIKVMGSCQKHHMSVRNPYMTGWYTLMCWYVLSPRIVEFLDAPSMRQLFGKG